MSTNGTVATERPSQEVCAEAAAWVARLHGSERTHEMEAGFRRWLEVSAAHAQAFELATEAWELSGGLAGAALPRMTRRPRSATTRRLAQAAAMAVAAAAAVVGTALYLRDTGVSTGVGEQRTVTLEDGSRVFLNTDTRVVVDYQPQRRRVTLERGEALFEVGRAPNRPFIVAAGDRAVTAIGTAFVVRRDERQTVVTLVEGSVSVAPVEAAAAARSEVRTLRPGDRLTLARDRPPTLDQPAIADVTAWQHGHVVLDHTRLAEAIDEMNRYSLVKLSLDDVAAAEIRVSGIFRTVDSVRFARAVAETYRLEVIDEPRRIVLKRP